MHGNRKLSTFRVKQSRMGRFHFSFLISQTLSGVNFVSLMASKHYENSTIEIVISLKRTPHNLKLNVEFRSPYWP